VSNLYLNTGHGTLGWTMACGSGRLLADIMSGVNPEIRADDLSVERYQPASDVRGVSSIGASYVKRLRLNTGRRALP